MSDVPDGHLSDSASTHFFDHSVDLLGILSLEGKFIRVNKAYERALGWSESELVGMSIMDLIHPDDLERTLSELQRLVSSGRLTADFQVRVRTKDDEYRWFLASGTPIVSEGAIYSVAVDITERKIAEHKLASSEARLAEVQALANLGSYEWNVEEQTITWSDELFRIYGVELGTFEPSYESLLSFNHPDDVDHVKQVIAAGFAQRSPVDFEYRIVRDTGEVRHLHARGKVEVDDQGRPVKLIGAVLDVTDRKEAERTRRELEEIRAQQHQALEINDNIVQGLVVAQLALDEGQPEVARRVIQDTLDAAQSIVSDLLANAEIKPGDLVRNAPGPSVWQEGSQGG